MKEATSDFSELSIIVPRQIDYSQPFDIARIFTAPRSAHWAPSFVRKTPRDFPPPAPLFASRRQMLLASAYPESMQIGVSLTVGCPLKISPFDDVFITVRDNVSSRGRSMVRQTRGLKGVKVPGVWSDTPVSQRRANRTVLISQQVCLLQRTT